eukprot:gene19751-26443_t
MASHSVVEVPASSTTKDVVGAIMGSTATPKQSTTQNKWFLLGFAFIVCFGIVVYFREEIYTFTKDVKRHPILSGEETAQIHQYLGSKWLFGAGKDVEKPVEPAVQTEMKPAEKPKTGLPKESVDMPVQPAANKTAAAVDKVTAAEGDAADRISGGVPGKQGNLVESEQAKAMKKPVTIIVGGQKEEEEEKKEEEEEKVVAAKVPEAV